MLTSVLASLLLTLGLTQALPLAPRAGSSRGCAVVGTGTLSANVTGMMHGFDITSDSYLSYNGGSGSFQVQLRACGDASEFSGGPYTGDYLGDIYVPSKKQCLTVPVVLGFNGDDAPPPYTIQLGSCETTTDPAKLGLPASQAFNFQYVSSFKSFKTYFVGWSDESTNQGGCDESGFLGYMSHDKGVPSLDSHNRVQLNCKSHTTPFYIPSSQ